VASFSFLGFCSDFNGKLDGFLESITGTRVNRFDRLDVDVGDDEFVLGESESVFDFSMFINPENGGTNEFGGMFVELVKRVASNCTTDTGGNYNC